MQYVFISLYAGMSCAGAEFEVKVLCEGDVFVWSALTRGFGINQKRDDCAQNEDSNNPKR